MVYERLELNSDLPENTRYQDEGCSLSNSCLECPFPCCVYDLPGGEKRLFKEKQKREIIRLAGSGLTQTALASQFKLSRRTIHRILKKAKEIKPSE